MPIDVDSAVNMLLDYLSQNPEETAIAVAGPQFRPTIATAPEPLPAFA